MQTPQNMFPFAVYLLLRFFDSLIYRRHKGNMHMYICILVYVERFRFFGILVQLFCEGIKSNSIVNTNTCTTSKSQVKIY